MKSWRSGIGSVAIDQDGISLASDLANLRLSFTSGSRMRRKLASRTALCVLVSACCVSLSTPVVAQNGGPAENNTLVIKVENTRNDNGRIGCALFWKNRGFPRKHRRALRRTWAEINSGTAECVFKRTGLGDYAVSVFHDEDGDGKLGTTFFGVPEEGWGVSNNVQPRRLGFPPRFRDATFKYEGGPMELTVQLIY